MGDHAGDCGCGGAMGRRGLLGSGAVLASLGALGAAPLLRAAPAFAMSQAERAALSPDQIIALMKAGNARVRTGEHHRHDHVGKRGATAGGQYPAAVILSCIDSRSSSEIVFDLGIGDVFSARVAGNIVDGDLLGSLEFACAVAGSKVVLVMGHTACGAIKGAIDRVELGNLTGLLQKIRPAVEATAYAGDRSGKNGAFVDAVSHTNVKTTLAEIRRQSPVLAGLEAKGTIRMAGAMHHLGSGLVDFIA